MRLLKWVDDDRIGLTPDLDEDERPPYAILSHTWAKDNDEEVLFAEIETAQGQKKPGYNKIRFCAEQARKDGITHFWVDTCCIDRTNLVELSEAITSMCRWYQAAVKCYVYLHDVPFPLRDPGTDTEALWLSAFRASHWFTRGWTLQELLIPKTVEFFSCEGALLGNKKTLAQQIHKITTIPKDALGEASLTRFSVAERMRWAQPRQTKKPEDRAYSLLGVFDVSIPVIYGEGEKMAFRRLQGAIREQAGLTTRSVHTHWMVPRSANALFTGRQTLLQELEDTIRDSIDCPWDAPQCRIVISGIGGQGKSEVCLQLARRLRHVFWAVIWIDVSTEEIAEQSLLQAAQKMSISAHDRTDALHGLANLQQSWLLVLDNADDPDVDYREYFPDSRDGVILMTTRNDQCAQYSTEQAIALEGLDINEAQELLLKAVRTSASTHDRYAEDARQVASLLQSHPLALIQASAYISRGHCTLADYPDVYNRQRQRLLTFRPTQARSRYGDVYATFEVSAEMLRVTNSQVSQDALQLLSLLVVFEASQIPLSFFEAGWRAAKLIPNDRANDIEDDEVWLLTPWHVARLPAICNVSSGEWDSYRLVEAVHLLRTFSLLSSHTREDNLYVSFHALVHAWARDRQDETQQQQSWLQMGCLTACALSTSYWKKKQYRTIQPHIEALVGWPLGSLFSSNPAALVARILVRCGDYLLGQRADQKVFTLLQRMLTALGLKRLEVEQKWIGIFFLSGQNLHNHGQAPEAVSILEQVVAIRRRTKAPQNADRLNSQYSLAQAYKVNGQAREAIAVLEEIIGIEKKMLDAEDSNLLATKRTLAGAYRANGQVKEAIALLEEVVKIQKRIFAGDIWERYSSQNALAVAYSANGQDEEAVELLRELVEVDKQTLGEDHPARLASLNNLATCLWHLGNYKEAHSIMANVVEIQKQTLYEQHPDRQDCEQWLAIFAESMASDVKDEKT